MVLFRNVLTFSKRAFLNGKMDLTEADGLIDLIHAETVITNIALRIFPKINLIKLC